MKSFTAFILAVILAATAFAPAACADDFPLDLLNTKSGISLTLSGQNGKDWAVERTFHDDSIACQVLYVRSPVQFFLAHNERNTILMDTPKIPRLVGINGADGKPGSGDEGDIHWKIDRDLQAGNYAGGPKAVAPFAPKYESPFTFDTLTYDGTLKVLGSVGDNGGKWGSAPMSTADRFAYGQRDAFGNEWHTVTYWDDDIPVYNAANVPPHRQGASDGHCVFVCVNPLTPVIQLKAPEGEQFYTTPIKTYFVPKIWPQTTYLTSGVLLSFVNLTNDQPIQFRINNAEFKPWDGKPVRAADLGIAKGASAVLDVRCGPDGAVLRRPLVLDPDYPAPAEKHGYLLWKDDAGRDEMVRKVHSVEPFASSWRTFTDGYYQGFGATFSDVRGGWRATAGQASVSLSNALAAAVEGPDKMPDAARLAKTRLLRMFRLQPVGFELTVNAPTPAKDYFNELSQTMQQFLDAAIAYDLLAGCYRRSQNPEGMTPIEELRIRDGLADVTKCLLQFRDNNSAISGAGDTHWAHGYELLMAGVALAMPTYSTPCFGVSGGDLKSTNDLKDADGKFWNPFPDQGVTWWAAATDPRVAAPGYPNVVAPFRAEFLLTDDGWWSGPNDLVGDGDRYYTGPLRRTLVDVKHGGLSNADCRVELVEMHGYESPFVERCYAVDFMRRIRGDATRALCSTNYIRRRLVCGVTPVSWDEDNKRYVAGEPSITTALEAFNPAYDFAGLPTPMSRVRRFLDELEVYYGKAEGTLDAAARKRLDDQRKILYDPYVLALCADPDTISVVERGAAGPNNPPIVKPLFKIVVHPGETVWKDVLAMDLDDDPLTLSVDGLPPGAKWDAPASRITWTTGPDAAGAWIVNVTAYDGKAKTTRPMLIAVIPDDKRKDIPPPPKDFRAVLADDGHSVRLTWAPVEGAKAFLVYRDGVLWAAAPGDAASFTDSDLIVPNCNTRYHLAVVNATGGESAATAADPAMLRY